MNTISLRSLCLLALAFPTLISAATITVKSTADAGGPCSGPDCTLREAIATAVSGGTINFSLPAGSTITLTSGQLLINKNLTINGPGANLLTVQRGAAAGNSRIFNINSNFNVTISGLTIANGHVGNGGAGGIYNEGTLTLTASIISGNSAISGGGISNYGKLTMTNSTVSDNMAFSGNGGGIDNSGTNTVTITSSSISGNSASSEGGGIYSNGGTVNLFNSTVSGNSDTDVNGLLLGGGIYNLGTFNITNSTISGNSSNGGGGILCDNGTVTITNSTISTNSANFNSGGIYTSSASTVIARNTIIALNTAPDFPDFYGTLTSQGYNLIGNTSGTDISIAGGGTTTGNQLDVDPKLDTLKDNGGPTSTHALRSGSPAIEGGNSFGSNTDQRGFARPVVIPDTSPIGDGSDIGAYEVQADLLPGCTTINREVKNNNDSGTDSLRAVIANVCAGSTITFAENVRGAISLTGGQLLITKSLTINGPGANLLSVQRSFAGGTPAFRVFNVASANVIATIAGLTISNGATSATTFGGGISNQGTLILSNAVISGNSAGFGGGGIHNDGGTLSITSSTISGNSTPGGAAGVLNNGTLTLTNSTISDNMAQGGNGGGIVNSLTITLTNSTISGNSASGGGGGVHNSSGTVRSGNTIIALNTAAGGPDFNGALTSDGFNLIGNGSGAAVTPVQFSDQKGTAGSPINPILGQLQNNGGPTFTRALGSGSTAINAGSDDLAPKLDQRGYLRSGVVDIGAFEFAGTPLRITSITRLGNGHVVLHGIGVPSGQHTLSTYPSLGASADSSGPVTANGSGVLQFDDGGSVGQTKRFYHLTFP